MKKSNKSYPASLHIDYPPKLNKVTTFFRVLLVIPVAAVLALLMAAVSSEYVNEAGKEVTQTGGGIAAGLFAATALMILFRQRYPRWWFDFNLELNRFSARVQAYALLLTDHYPSTIDAQSVHLDIKYPNVKKDLNRWLPLVKWLLAFPHYIVLTVLLLAAVLATIVGWFAILFTGRYPKVLFEFVVGVNRWGLRVSAYAFLLVTDTYPPFSLNK
jgi:hypothetical protein